MKDNNVNIKIHGISSIPDSSEKEHIKSSTEGRWVIKNGRDHIIYTDNELLETLPTRTRVSIGDGDVSIHRSGQTTSNLHFEKDVKHSMPYPTPYGVFDMTTLADEIRVTREATSIDLFISYDLELNGESLGKNTFQMKIDLIADSLE